MNPQKTAIPQPGSPLGKQGNEYSTAVAVRGMFSAVAPRYDFLNHFLSFGFALRVGAGRSWICEAEDSK